MGKARTQAGARRRARAPRSLSSADPTRTATLRRRFAGDVRRRIRELKGRILDLVVREDAFGLKQRRGLPVGPVGNLGIARPSVWNNRFAFDTTDQQLEGFAQWLSEQVGDLLPPPSPGNTEPWVHQYLQESFRKGQGRSFDDVRKAGLNDGAFFAGSRAEFLRESFGSAPAIERVRLLAARTMSDLKGVTDEMAKQIKRELVDGMIQGKNPREIARAMNSRIDKIGRHRATLIARTEIVRAHAEGQLMAMERLGVKELGVMVEWDHAGDDRVCPLCLDLGGAVVTLKEASGMLPRHPQCRCAWIPANVGEDKRGQKRGSTAVRRAIDSSILKERKGRRSLKEAKEASTWPGADKRIAKKRPTSLLDTPEPKPTATRKMVTPPKPKPLKGGKATQHMEEHAQSANLTPTESRALYDYGTASFRGVNDGLRSGALSAEDAARVRELDAIMKKQKLDRSLTVHRGFRDKSGSIPKDLKPGDVIEDKAFLSTSLDPEVASDRGAFTARGVVMEIEVPEGSAATYLAGEEAEVLLDRGARLLVESVETLPSGARKVKAVLTDKPVPKPKPKAALKPKPKPKPKPKAKPKPKPKPKPEPPPKPTPKAKNTLAEPEVQALISDYERAERQFKRSKGRGTVHKKRMDRALGRLKTKGVVREGGAWTVRGEPVAKTAPVRVPKQPVKPPYREELRKWKAGLSAEEKEAIEWWSESIYTVKDVRDFAAGRAVAPESAAKARAFLNAMDRAPRMNGTVYRGQSLDEIASLKTGDQFKFGNVVSTSKDFDVGEEFVEYAVDNKVLFEVRTKSAVDISDLVGEEYLDQAEAFLPDVAHRVVAIKKEPEFTRVVLEEL